MPRADRIPCSEWDRNKEHIRALYLGQDTSLDELVTSMAKLHGFHASKAQYIRKLGAWNMKKYSSKDDWKRADALIRKRKVAGKGTEILMNGKLIPAKKLKKELGRYAWQQTHGQSSLVEDAPKGVIARTPPPSAMDIVVGRAIPWFRFQNHLSSLMARNSLRDASPGTLRPVILPPAKPVDILPFVNKVLITGPRTQTLSEATSIMEAQMPRAPDVEATLQVSRRGSDPWFLALRWAIYRCTNNLLSPRQIDEFLGFISASGNLAVLKGICRMPGPTTKTLMSKLLPSAIRLRDLALADFLLSQGADPEINYSNYLNFSILQAAARDHNDDVVQLLLEHGACPDHANEDGETPLHLALKTPRGLSTAKLLVQAGADVNSSSHAHCRSSLMRVVAHQDMDAVEFLIEAGADVNYFSLSHSSALQTAVEACDLEMVRLLLSAGADPNLGANLRTSLPLHEIKNPSRLPLAAAARIRNTNIILASVEQQQQSQDSCQRQIIDLLLQAGADVNAIPPLAPWGRAETAMQAAAGSGDFDICSLFISHGGDIHAPALGEWGMTCLQAAAFSGNIDIVYLLLGMGANMNEATSETGWTTLQAAASSGNIELVNLLLGLGANVNHRSPMTALEVAVDESHPHMVERLLDAGADIDQSGRLGSALFSAARNQDLGLFDLLMGRGADPDPPGCHVSPLMAATRGGWFHGVQVLIQAGANVNKQCTKPNCYNLPPDVDWDWDVKVPLVAAVMTDEVEFVEILLNAGAKFSAQTSRCLEFAVRSRANDIVLLLLQNGANPDQRSLGASATTPIHIAVMEEEWIIYTEVLETLIEFGANVNARSDEGYPLEIISNSIQDMNEALVGIHRLRKARDLLLRAGADPSLFGHRRSKLQHAVEKGDIVEVQSFISSGEDINEPANYGGATALQYAAMHGHLNITMLLIENGARINAPGGKPNGRTALQAAAENGRLDTVHLLLEHDDEPELLQERCYDAAEYAEDEGHRVIAQSLREWKNS